MQINTRVIAIANQKGGVGKTTTVVNLAAALSKMRRTVLVIDLDPQANATTGLGLQPQEGVSLYPCLLGTQQIADMIQPTPYENLNVIPSEVNLSGSEIDLAQRPDRLQVVRNVLQAIRDANVFDYILLDCPPSLGILMTSTLAAADGILVPMQAEYYALEGLGVMQNLIERLKARKETRWHSFAENLDYPEKNPAFAKYVNSRLIDGKVKMILRDLVQLPPSQRAMSLS